MLNKLTPNDGLVVSNSGNVTFPRFIRKEGGRVLIDPTLMPADRSFWIFVDRLYSQGARFVGLDYACFQKLLYHPDVVLSQKTEIRLATEIVVFAPERKALYKEVRILNHEARAEYMFEPAFLEVSVEEPVYGKPDESGNTPITGYQTIITIEPTQLDIDEFFAAMWTKGVRFGIQVPVVQSAIAANKADRVVVALELLPVPGKDAELKEMFEGLRRDNSPLIRAGIADLRRFTNRFPQVAKGQRMLKKIPKQLGEPGFKVTGILVEPDKPKDLDLDAMAGPGTKIELTHEGMFLVAVADGFIAIDLKSNQVSVNEKIENKGGISIKTTGNLSLTVDEFIEHGEVQEGRIVEGKHMKFTSAVYGSLFSDAGRIEIDDNLIGGSATSPAGSITIKRRASNACVEAVGGSIDIHYAENSTIIGDAVTIEHAINCAVVANKLHVGLTQGCTLAAKFIDIGKSDSRKGIPTVVSVLVPTLADVVRQIAALKTSIQEIELQAKAKLAELKKLVSEPELSKFLSIQERLRTGNVTVSPALEHNFRIMQSKHAASLKVMGRLMKEKQALVESIHAKRQEILPLEEKQTAQTAGLGCTIHEVVGETTVQQFRTNLRVANFKGTSVNNLANLLRTGASHLIRIFSDDIGSVEWHYTLPENA